MRCLRLLRCSLWLLAFWCVAIFGPIGYEAIIGLVLFFAGSSLCSYLKSVIAPTRSHEVADATVPCRGMTPEFEVLPRVPAKFKGD